MAVRHVPVRNTTTGETRDLPETALRHFPDWERIDPDTGEPLTAAGTAPAAEPAGADAGSSGDETTASKTTRKGRASAKDTKE